MPKAIVIGASSGIGKALAKVLAQKGYEVGLASRRVELLKELQQEIQTKTYVRHLDLTNIPESITSLKALLQEMGIVDLIVVNSGVMFDNPDFDWDKENSTIQINVLGFSAMAHTAMNYFLNKGTGHLVGISSVSALRGEWGTPSYSASKAFVSNFLEGLKIKAIKEKKEICISDIKPGWVETDMAKGQETFWMSTPKVTAEQIYAAIENKRSHAYVTRRWRLYAWFVKWAPLPAYIRFFQ